MAWTKTTRAQYGRRRSDYASDCSDEEWAVVAPFLVPLSTVGRPRKHASRVLWNAIQYIASTGCLWDQLPLDFPSFTTVQYHFYRLRDTGLLDVINAALVMVLRVIEGRNAEPSAGIIDSQSVKTGENGGPRGYDAGKKIKGHKRHIVTDTGGNFLEVLVHEAGIQDRDGAVPTIASVMQSYPALETLFADCGYAGPKLTGALTAIYGPKLEIIKRSDSAVGFAVIARRWTRRWARRWVVERAFAWLNRCRRLAKDWETSIASSTAWLLIASIRRMTRAIARA